MVWGSCGPQSHGVLNIKEIALLVFSRGYDALRSGSGSAARSESFLDAIQILALLTCGVLHVIQGVCGGKCFYKDDDL